MQPFVLEVVFCYKLFFFLLIKKITAIKSAIVYLAKEWNKLKFVSDSLSEILDIIQLFCCTSFDNYNCVLKRCFLL